MDKVYYCHNRKRVYLKPLNHRIKNLIREWYLFADHLSTIRNSRIDICVYRGVKNMDPYKICHIQPIPFSTCIDICNASEWILPNHPQSFIMCINVTSQIPYTFTGNADEGHEVILPSGKLWFQDKVHYKNTCIIKYIFLSNN